MFLLHEICRGQTRARARFWENLEQLRGDHNNLNEGDVRVTPENYDCDRGIPLKSG